MKLFRPRWGWWYFSDTDFRDEKVGDLRHLSAARHVRYSYTNPTGWRASTNGYPADRAGVSTSRRSTGAARARCSPSRRRKRPSRSPFHRYQTQPEAVRPPVLSFMGKFEVASYCWEPISHGLHDDGRSPGRNRPASEDAGEYPGLRADFAILLRCHGFEQIGMHGVQLRARSAYLGDFQQRRADLDPCAQRQVHHRDSLHDDVFTHHTGTQGDTLAGQVGEHRGIDEQHVAVIGLGGVFSHQIAVAHRAPAW